MTDHVAALVERARLAEREAVDALFDTAFPRLLTYVRFQSEDASVSEEIAIDVLMAAARELGTETIASELDLFCWLFRMVRNKLDDHRFAWADPESDSSPSTISTVNGLVNAPEESGTARGFETARQALLRLPRDQREVVICTCLLGFSTSDAAYMLSLRSEESERLLYLGLGNVDATLSASRTS